MIFEDEKCVYEHKSKWIFEKVKYIKLRMSDPWSKTFTRPTTIDLRIRKWGIQLGGDVNVSRNYAVNRGTQLLHRAW